MRTNEMKMQEPSLYVLPVCEILGFIQIRHKHPGFPEFSEVH